MKIGYNGDLETRLKIKNGSIQEINDEFDSVSRCNSGMMYDAEDS